MWIILIVGVVIVVGALIALLFSRPRASDLSSVRKYHSALGTIEHMADRTGPSAGRVIPPPGSPGGGDGAGAGRAGRPVPPVPVRGSGGFPDPETPIVFDDARPKDRWVGGADGGDLRPRGAPIHRADRAQRHALESMNHRPRRTTAVMVVVILVALFATLAVLGSRHPKSADRGHKSASTTSTAAPAHHQGQDGSHSQAENHAHGKKDHTSTTAPTSTTVPTQIVALSSTPLTAVYPVGPSSYKVKVSASGPCWVLATATATGSTLWTGTLQAGGSQVIEATGVITVELGAPSATLALDSVPVVLPTPVHTPFVATFQPTATGSGAASTATTAPVTATTAPTG